MLRHGGWMIAGGADQFPPAQELERGLHGALGKAGFLGEHAQAGRDWFPFSTRRLAVEMEVNEVCRRLAIVPHDVAHENIKHVIVDGNGSAKTRHYVL